MVWVQYSTDVKNALDQNSLLPGKGKFFKDSNQKSNSNQNQGHSLKRNVENDRLIVNNNHHKNEPRTNNYGTALPRLLRKLYYYDSSNKTPQQGCAMDVEETHFESTPKS